VIISINTDIRIYTDNGYAKLKKSEKLLAQKGKKRTQNTDSIGFLVKNKIKKCLVYFSRDFLPSDLEMSI
jgi:hypothetical protein